MHVIPAILALWDVLLPPPADVDGPACALSPENVDGLVPVVGGRCSLPPPADPDGLACAVELTSTWTIRMASSRSPASTRSLSIAKKKHSRMIM